ncbi:unnamed protein product [Adineta steineri]|uniref:Uncharacterized protein n=1 Tax=Adineta steineri TaxID=433720 RepID=A0A820CXA7_9BILA|nr:unnamed protein product [Adineta steineri]
MAFLLDLLGLGHSKNAYDQVYQQQNNYGGDYQNYGDNMQQPHHKASWTHELIGGAAGFAGQIHVLFIVVSRKSFITI